MGKVRAKPGELPSELEAVSRAVRVNFPSSEWTTGRKTAVLTFDDGPEANVTPRILDVLGEQEIKAVFFIVGKRVCGSEVKKILMRAVAEGHALGNHGFTHADLTTQSYDAVLSDLNRTQCLLESLGVRFRLFRPPYGAVNQNMLRAAEELGYSGLLWNVDTFDWRDDQQPSGWIDQAFRQAIHLDRAVVLMHDIHESTANGITTLIQRLREVGYKFPQLFDVQLSQLIADSDQFEEGPFGWFTLPGLCFWQPRSQLKLRGDVKGST